MRILIFILFVVNLISCSATKDIPDCVDYTSDAFWKIPGDSLILDLTGDLMGRLAYDLKTNHGNFSGIFRAPLGDNSFAAEGSISWKGLVVKQGNQYEMLLRVESGTKDFDGIRGIIEGGWLREEEQAHLGGTLCNF